MNAEDWPDMTLEEVQESDEYDTEDMNLQEDISDELDDHMEAMVILAASNALAKMVEQNRITLRQYIELTDHLAEWERDLDESPLM